MRVTTKNMSYDISPIKDGIQVHRYGIFEPSQDPTIEIERINETWTASGFTLIIGKPIIFYGVKNENGLPKWESEEPNVLKLNFF